MFAPENRQLDAVSGCALLSAAAIFAMLVAFAMSPHVGSPAEEQFSAAMKGESNGETGSDAVPAIGDAI